MGATSSTPKSHTCGEGATSSRTLLSPCQKCAKNRITMFDREAEVRTKAWLYPDKYRLEFYDLSEDPSWVDTALCRSADVIELKEKAIRDVVKVYCLKDTLPRTKNRCVCGGGMLEMKEIQKILADERGESQPQGYLSFEPPRTPSPKPQTAQQVVVEEPFVIGDDDDEEDEETQDSNVNTVNNQESSKKPAKKSKFTEKFSPGGHHAQ